MTLQYDISILDPFTYTKQDRETIWNFDFIGENSKKQREKVMIDETFCTFVTVGGKYLEKKKFLKVMKKINEIRRIFRQLYSLNNSNVSIDI